MNETNIEWSDLNLFLAVARGGGLAAGAKISGLSPPSLGRHMLDLERALGETLFHRLPRGYALTEAGLALLAEVETVEEHILGIARRRSNRNAKLPIHITAGTWMTRFLAMHIRDISAEGVRLVFRAAEARHDIGRREATIGVRNSRPDEADLAALIFGMVVAQHRLNSHESLPVDISRIAVLDHDLPVFHRTACRDHFTIRIAGMAGSGATVDKSTSIGRILQDSGQRADAWLPPRHIAAPVADNKLKYRPYNGCEGSVTVIRSDRFIANRIGVSTCVLVSSARFQ